MELKGKYNTAKVYTDNVEQTAIDQIINLCNQRFIKNSRIRVMPDVHAGKGSVVGLTMTGVNESAVVPNLVGVDIGCGVTVIKISKEYICEKELHKLDSFIRNNVPSGREVHDKPLYSFIKQFIPKFYCSILNVKRAELSLGTLGGGNHYIEISINEKGEYFLTIHSGSRYLGKQIAEYWQDIAKSEEWKNEISLMIARLKAGGREKEIQKTLEEMKKLKPENGLEYLNGESAYQYLHDALNATEYASLNRNFMATEILKGMDWKGRIIFETVHNYISRDGIMRKGAVDASLQKPLIIPMNMRDGSLICRGKGNVEWNFSAPHGAGRIMSRGVARKNVSLKEYEESMKGIYTTSVNESTIDESPMAYKDMNEIIKYIGDTVEIVDIIKPIYNFKAGE